MDEKRLRGLMGLSTRAGQGLFGADKIEKAIRAGNCGVLILDGGISAASRERYEGLCAREGIPAAVSRPGLIAEATGKPGAAMGVRPGALAEQMAECLRETAKE